MGIFHDGYARPGAVLAASSVLDVVDSANGRDAEQIYMFIYKIIMKEGNVGYIFFADIILPPEIVDR